MRLLCIIIPLLLVFPILSFSQVQLIESIENSCDITKDAYSLRTRISNITHNEDTCTIEVAFKDICGQNFTGSIRFQNDTLNLSYNIPEVEIFCTCCYSILYKVTGFKEDKHHIQFKGKDIPITDKEYIETIMKRDTLEDGTPRLIRTIDGIINLEVLLLKDKKIIRHFSADRQLKEERIDKR
jgi:hypothetical protein